MARDLDSDVQAAALASPKNIAVLMEADFDDASIRLFGGYGTMTIDGVDYIGDGQLLSIDPAQETSEVQATSATVQLSGVQEADIAVTLTENYQGRPCRLKLAFFNTGHSGEFTSEFSSEFDVSAGDGDEMSLIGSPVTVFSGRMDVMTVSDDPNNPVITMTAESEFIRMAVARQRNRTHEDQQIDYPGDKGLEFVAAMQNKTIFV